MGNIECEHLGADTRRLCSGRINLKNFKEFSKKLNRAQLN